MASTAILSVKEGIASALEGIEGLEGVTISAGKEPERKAEFIWVPDAKASRRVELIRTPPTPLTEDVRATIVVVAIKGSAEAAEERAFEIFNTAEAVLRELTNGVGSAEYGHYIESVDAPATVPVDNKWACEIKAVLLAQARI